jgi:hypothetical protein
LNPLVKVNQAHQKGIIPDKEYSLIKERFPITVAGINRIEKAAGINFPIAYVEPSIIFSSHEIPSYQYGILFANYLELIRKFSKMEILSDEITGNLFESVYADKTRLFEPRVVFKDKTLLLHITKKFPAGFRDYKLEDKVIKNWIEKDLPKSNIALDSNIVKLSVESLSKIK